jgi:hypothetical protein
MLCEFVSVFPVVPIKVLLHISHIIGVGVSVLGLVAGSTESASEVLSVRMTVGAPVLKNSSHQKL